MCNGACTRSILFTVEHVSFSKILVISLHSTIPTGDGAEEIADIVPCKMKSSKGI